MLMGDAPRLERQLHPSTTTASIFTVDPLRSSSIFSTCHPPPSVPIPFDVPPLTPTIPRSPVPDTINQLDESYKWLRGMEEVSYILSLSSQCMFIIFFSCQVSVCSFPIVVLSSSRSLRVPFVCPSLPAPSSPYVLSSSLLFSVCLTLHILPSRALSLSLAPLLFHTLPATTQGCCN